MRREDLGVSGAPVVSMLSWTLIAAVNDRRVLEQSLLRSPDVGTASRVFVQEGFASAASAYNGALAQLTSGIAVLAHQDVYLPAGWLGELEAALGTLSTLDPEWGVLGVYGTTPAGASAGYTYSVGLG